MTTTAKKGRTCGTASGYDGGCRCDGCRAAIRVKQQKYRLAQRLNRSDVDRENARERRAADRARAAGIVEQRVDVSWHERKACGPDQWALFFPETGSQHAYARARAICSVCDARRDCLEAALVEERGQIATRRHGMRGGLTPAERVEWEKAQDHVPEAEPGGLFCGRDPAELLAKPHVCAVDGCRCGR